MDDLEKQQEGTLGGISLAWEGLGFEIDGKRILENVSGQVSSGEMLAVMGPSGV